MSWKFLCPKAIFCEIFNQWMENMHILFPALTLEIRVPLTTLAVNILTGYMPSLIIIVKLIITQAAVTEKV